MKEEFDYVIVGSGITGILVAEELLSKGYTVATIDIGFDIPAENKSLIETLSSVSPKDATGRFLAWRHKKIDLDSTIANKELFGFSALSSWSKFFNLSFYGTEKIGPAVLKGGYSRVWGGVCMSFGQVKDFIAAIPSKDSNEILSDVYKYLGLPTQHSVQIENHNECVSDEVIFSKPLIANNNNIQECNSCGLCLQGCPQSVIFDASVKIRSLQQSDRYYYFGSLKAQRVVETAKNARVYCQRLSADQTFPEYVLTGKKVLLAAGPIASSEIVCRSLGIKSDVRMQWSGYFTAVAFRLNKMRQLIEMMKPEGFDGLSRLVCRDKGENLFFLQFYAADPIIRFYALSANIWTRFIRKIIGGILEKVVVPVQGYLNSSVCQKVVVSYGEGMTTTNISSNHTRIPTTSLAMVKSSLKKEGISLYGIKFGLPGAGYHFGCSFPMSEESSTFSSNSLGVPSGLVNTHMIDASTLPSIPAGPFTTVVLWNALRIVRELTLAES
jgi:ferredoxin